MTTSLKAELAKSNQSFNKNYAQQMKKKQKTEK